jgi:hypothetical protein
MTDSQDVPVKVNIGMTVGTFLSLAYFVLAMISTEEENFYMDMVSYGLLFGSFVISIIVGIRYLRKGKEHFDEYQLMVMKSLTRYFKELNSIYEPKGIYWYLVQDFYWLECRVMKNRIKKIGRTRKNTFSANQSSSHSAARSKLSNRS